MLCVASLTATAGILDENLQTTVQQMVPVGGIVFCGTLQTSRITYQLFVLEQEGCRGVLVLTRDAGDSPLVLFADTSIDFALDQGLISPELRDPFYALLGTTSTRASQPATVAPGDDIYPIGAALNTVLGPIGGFTFRSNSTLGILRELEESDAIPVSPAVAPTGSILVCPTTYSQTGSVSLGSVVILGSDHKVYGLDIRQGGAWTCFGLLEAWVEKYGADSQLFGFLLRAHPEHAST